MHLRRAGQAKQTRRIWKGLFVLKAQPSQQCRASHQVCAGQFQQSSVPIQIQENKQSLSQRIYPNYWVYGQDKLTVAGDLSENDCADKKENRENMPANQAQWLSQRLQFAPVDVTHIDFLSCDSVKSHSH